MFVRQNDYGNSRSVRVRLQVIKLCCSFSKKIQIDDDHIRYWGRQVLILLAQKSQTFPTATYYEQISLYPGFRQSYFDDLSADGILFN